MIYEHQDIVINDQKVISMGAEARIYSGYFLQYPVIVKHRFSKKYRNSQIDNLLRKNRTIQEVRLLQTAKKLGVNVPYVFDVDKFEWKIVMEYLFGDPLRVYIKHNKSELANLFFKLGEMIGLLHQNDIIHGDLTTSNIILIENELWLIDFGLGYISNSIEDKAVDILVLKHTLESSHTACARNCFNAFLQGYKNYTSSASIIKRLDVVEGRVRYKKSASK